MQNKAGNENNTGYTSISERYLLKASNRTLRTSPRVWYWLGVLTVVWHWVWYWLGLLTMGMVLVRRTDDGYGIG